MGSTFLKLLAGMGVSVEIFILTLLFSLPLGLLVAFGRMSKNGILRFFCENIYCDYEGNASYAPVDCGVFCPLLCIWN